ncbi:MAG TPA: flagellar hook-length control protein FliK [Gemmataceae bacterium]|nr:flagellar hook-length control protein FliK [Gemmataceae bacterium]
MNIQPSVANLADFLTSPANAGPVLRLLGGAILDAQLGKTVPAIVQQSNGNQATLLVQSKPILVESPIPLEAGAELVLKILRAGTQPRLEIQVQKLPDVSEASTTNPSALPSLEPQRATASILAAPTNAAGPAAATAPSSVSATILAVLETGSQITATVTRALPEGRVLLDIQGISIEATTPEPFPPGTKLTLEVEQHVSTEPTFHIVEVRQPLTSLATMVLQNLVQHQPLGPALEHLHTVVGQASAHPAVKTHLPSLEPLQQLLRELLPREGPPDAERIASFLEANGQHYEAKLFRTVVQDASRAHEVVQKDLKGLLLQTIKEAAAAPPRHDATTTDPAPLMQQLVRAVTQHLDHIEGQQALNALTQAHGEPQRFQLPFVAQAPVTAYLAVDQEVAHDSPGQQSPRGHRLLLALDLTELGPTRIDAHFTPHSLDVAFYVEKQEALERIRPELPSLRQVLESLGYGRVSVAVQSDRELSEEAQRQFTALTAGVPATINLLDVRA